MEKENEEMLQRLERYQRNMELIHESLGSGQWSIEFDNMGELLSCNWSDTFRRMLGYRNEEDFPNELESWTNLIYPDDRNRVLSAFWNAVNDYSGRLHYDVEYRINTRNTGLRWFHSAGRVSRRIDGTPITFVGLFIDINDKKERDEKFREQLNIVEALSRDYLNIYKINMETKTIEIMKQDAYIIQDMDRLGVEYDYAEFVEKYTSDQVLDTDSERMKNDMSFDHVETSLYKNGEYESNFRIFVNNEKHYIQFKYIRLSDDPRYVILGFKNIDALMTTTKERDNLKLLSETDIMTGLLNRGSGEKKAGEEIKKGYRGMLLLCDIDKFKSINDTFGHAVGDKVICNIANCLKNSFREGDVVFRLGGDEFAALALNVDSKVTATSIIDRLFERIDAIDIPELGDRKVTISVGATMMDGVFETSFAELYKKADTGVYESKKYNTNKVTFA